MKQFVTGSLIVLGVVLCSDALFADTKEQRIKELDAYWAEVSRAVREGDFKGYRATCHPEGVLVSGVRRDSEPLSEALARWKKGIDDTKAGKIKASVELRFTQRLNSSTTAHETGIFLYSMTDADGKRIDDYIHFEALLVKKKGKWLVLMEYQKSKATPKEWNALK